MFSWTSGKPPSKYASKGLLGSGLRSCIIPFEATRNGEASVGIEDSVLSVLTWF